MMTRLLLMLLSAAAALCRRAAQTYPERVIKIVVPQGPGGPTDLLARMTAQRLQSSARADVIIENRGGAGGAIATKMVAAAEPDGYTLLLGNTSTLAIIPALSRNAGYDPEKAFAPVAQAGRDLAAICSSIPLCRRRLSASLSPTPRPIPASSALRRPASATSSTSPAKCSKPAPASTWCTCPTTAAPRP